MNQRANKDNNDNNNSIVISTDTLYSIFIFGGLVGVSYIGFNKYLKQYTNVKQIPQQVFRNRWLYGKVTSVGDGDNFHFFHTPGGLIGGWGWLRSVPKLDSNGLKNESESKNNKSKKKYMPTQERMTWIRRLYAPFNNLKSNSKHEIKARSDYYLNLNPALKGKRSLPTIPIRICGIDAPERAHFGKLSQPFSDEALNWLRYQILGRRIWIKPLSVDQYNRCVARAVYWSWYGGWKDIGAQMLKEGLAVVYEGTTQAEFDGKENKYKLLEFLAQSQRKGLWIQKRIETPGAYKKRH